MKVEILDKLLKFRILQKSIINFSEKLMRNLLPCFICLVFKHVKCYLFFVAKKSMVKKHLDFLGQAVVHIVLDPDIKGCWQVKCFCRRRDDINSSRTSKVAFLSVAKAKFVVLFKDSKPVFSDSNIPSKAISFKSIKSCRFIHVNDCLKSCV